MFVSNDHPKLIFISTILSGLMMMLMVSPAAAEQGLCLQELTVEPVGELTLSLPTGVETLTFISLKIDGFVLEETEALSSAAYIQQKTDVNSDFHLWSLTAYTDRFIEQLKLSICGEDLLDALDAYQFIAKEGNPMAGASAALSPGQNAVKALFRKDREKSWSEIERVVADVAWQTIETFEASLPDRAGSFIINFRGIRKTLDSIMDRTDIELDEKLRLFNAFLSGGDTPSLKNPALLACPCQMQVLEAHVFGEGGLPFFAKSLSWQSADIRKVPFNATLADIQRNADGSYKISGDFNGFVYAMQPDPKGDDAFSKMTGIPSTVKDKEPISINGKFAIDQVMHGDLSKLAKLF